MTPHGFMQIFRDDIRQRHAAITVHFDGSGGIDLYDKGKLRSSLSLTWEQFETLRDALLGVPAADLIDALKATLPFLVRLGDFIANGEGPTGMERCDTIGAVKAAIERAEGRTP
jgi:hypothetical protein